MRCKPVVYGFTLVAALVLCQGQGCPTAIDGNLSSQQNNTNTNTNTNTNNNNVTVNLVDSAGGQWLFYFDASKKAWFPIRISDLNTLTAAEKATLTTDPYAVADDSDAIVTDETADGEVVPPLVNPDGDVVEGNDPVDPPTTIWRDADADGVQDADDKCPNSTLFPVDADGCDDLQLDDDGDGVSNYDDWCPNTIQGTVVDADGCSALTPIVVPDANVTASPVKWTQFFEGWIEGTGARPLGYEHQTSMDISLTATGGQAPYTYQWGFLTDWDCQVFESVKSWNGWTLSSSTSHSVKLTWTNKSINMWVRLRVIITDSAGQRLEYAVTPTLYYEGYAPGQESTAPLIADAGDDLVDRPQNAYADLSVSASGGTPPYTSYAWIKVSGVNGEPITPGNAVTAVPTDHPGVTTYRVTVTDSSTPPQTATDDVVVTVTAPTSPLSVSYTAPDARGPIGSRLTPALEFYYDGSWHPRERTGEVGEEWLPLGSGGWVSDMNVDQNGSTGLDLAVQVTGGKAPYTITWTWLKVIDGWIGNGVQELPGKTLSYHDGHSWTLSTLSGPSTHVTWTETEISGDDAASIVRVKVTDAEGQTITRFVYPRLYWDHVSASAAEIASGYGRVVVP